MKTYDSKAIRNVCLLSHGGVGKTTLLETACFTAKATTKLGRVDNGTSIFDVRADEKERRMTISMAVGALEWKEVKMNFLDTPGFLDFLGDAKASLRVVESALILIDGVAGPQVGTELVSRLVSSAGLPRMIVVNGLDKENVDFNRTVTATKKSIGNAAIPIQLPIGTGAGFKGVVDLISCSAFEYTPNGDGIGKKIDVPAAMADDIAAARSALMESVAESDEELMNKFFDAGELSESEIRLGLSKAFAAGSIFPMLCTCAGHNIGIDLLLDMISAICPPASSRTQVEVKKGEEKVAMACGVSEPTAAFVFKTISEEHVGELNIVRVFSGHLSTAMELHNVRKNAPERIGAMYYVRGKEKIDATELRAGDIGGLLKLKNTHTGDTLADKSLEVQFPKIEYGTPLVKVAISAKNKGDDDKIAVGLAKLHEEDPTFSFGFQADIHRSILAACGDIHIDVILESLRSRFKAEVERTEPKISFRETITKSVKYVEYTHKKQTGGAGQYAKVAIDMEPTARGEGYEFLDKIVGGAIDQSLRPSVDKGIRSKLTEGILAGYPIVDVRVALVDGKTHPVDSKDVAFQIAGREVFKKAFESASPILLEPIVDLAVTVPDEYTGDVMGDLSARRGKISGMEPEGKYQTVKAKVPESEVKSYSQALRSITQGRGIFKLTFSHYEPVPAEVTKKIIESAKLPVEE